MACSIIAKTIGGYDYEFVDPVPDDCTCPICTLVQRDAHQVTCCCKIYCKSCLEQLKKKAKRFECPNCRSSLKEERELTFFPDRNTISKINHLRIHCTNKERGCKWVGHLKDLDTVHRPECPNEIVECTNKKQSSEPCGAKIQRCDLTVHKTQLCQWRIVKCRHCNEEGYHNEITGIHLEECVDLELPCGNNGCPVKIKRQLMTQHHDECPKQTIACQYRFAGCEEKFTRESTQDHNKEFIQLHLDKAMVKLSEALSSIEELQSTDNKVFPTVIKVPIKWGKESISPGFYEIKGGYRLALKAYCGRGVEQSASSTGLNLYTHIAVMSGRHDDVLEWPVSGIVTVQLQNQEANMNHRIVVDYKEVEFNNKVVPPTVYGEWIHLADFTISEFYEKYIPNNSLYFKVKFHSDTELKPWLVDNIL